MSKRDERVLIINDDGIDAYGIDLLEQAARRLFHDVWVVAPATHQSGKSRSISLGGRLELKQHGLQRFSVTGSPVDTLLTAMHALFQDKRPGIVLSGVNQGGNLGEDVGYSGTASVLWRPRCTACARLPLARCEKSGRQLVRDDWAPGCGVRPYPGFTIWA